MNNLCHKGIIRKFENTIVLQHKTHKELAIQRQTNFEFFFLLLFLN